MNITLDFDEVLFPLLAPFLKFVNRPDIDPATVVDYNLWPVFNERTLHLIEQFYYSREIQQIPPEPGAVTGVAQLLAAGHSVFIVTGRPSKVGWVTRNQLIKHFPDLPIFSTDQYYPGGRNKRELCAKMKADAHVDDQVGHCNDCAEAGIRSIFVRRPWRYSTPLDPRVTITETWPQIVAALDPPSKHEPTRKPERERDHRLD